MATAAPALHEVALDDKYALDSGRVFLTGTQALVRLLILQRQRDLAAGLQHRRLRLGLPRLAAGRRSTRRCGRRRRFLDRAHITFQPGLNEDLAATSIWGTQQVNLYPGARYDGVFAMWYGKGPGVDRCGDVFKHANHAGTSKHGGVLVLAGDDHGAKSSTLPHQSDHVFSAAMIPVLYPSSVQEILDLGLHGWAMSPLLRLLGRLQVRRRHRRELGLGGRRSRPHADHRAGRLPAAAGRRVASAGPIRSSSPRRGCRTPRSTPRCTTRASTSSTASSSTRRSRALGIITSGKSYLDVRQALDDLGITERRRGRDRPARLQGGDALAARARGRARSSPRVWRRSSSSRRSARSSSTS